MLQLKTKTFDICRISKLIAKYNIKANISNNVITLDGKISDELLTELCNVVTIYNVQNYNSDGSNGITLSNSKTKDTISEVVLAPKIIEKYDLIYHVVKRGEVYLCDFGEPYGCEQGYKRYAIVVQNDDANYRSHNTIVLPCTTEKKKELPVHYSFIFSSENMIDYDVSHVGLKENIVMAEQIRTVDKTRLLKFLGTMTNEFMDKIQEIIDISLDLSRQEKTVSEIKNYIDVQADNTHKEIKNLNIIQTKIMNEVDTNKLFEIIETEDSDNIKVEKILKLFGFDMQKKGMEYLLKVILISTKEEYFNLETLCDGIVKDKPNIEKDKIKMMIVARVKERFKLKKAPTIEFIRLVNSLLISKEKKQDEEDDI